MPKACITLKKLLGLLQLFEVFQRITSLLSCLLTVHFAADCQKAFGRLCLLVKWHDQVSMLAGIMGYSLLGMLAWAQKLYLLSQLNIFFMPPGFQQFGETFKWSVLDIRHVL